MADVTTYKRCLQPYAAGGLVHAAGEVLPGGNAACLANPENWVALSDGDFTPGPTEDLIVIVT